MSREYIDYLKDIVDAMEKAIAFIEGMDFEKFEDDDKTAYAVIRALEIIGEATKKIPIDIKLEYIDIPWKDMAGMRDILIHDYFGVDYETVWLTVKDKIPQVLKAIKNMAEKIDRDK